MRSRFNAILGGAAALVAAHAAAQVTFYDAEGFHGSAFMVRQPTPNFSPLGFNDRASSAIVEHGRWVACADSGYRGKCIVLVPGNYPSLAPYDMNNRISSARPVQGNELSYLVVTPPPAPAPAYEYRWRPEEKLFEVPVSYVRAVVGPPEQRCWVERQQVVEPSQPNVPGAIIGGILGGVLGHQIGGGTGKAVATVGGAIAGTAIGSNVGKSPGGVYDQDVQRCEAVPGTAKPEYWDVTYYFGGVEHHVQMSAAPGPTIWVNGRGEPRG
ncbi:MAG TPA: beta/gamma crystallin-related protein [Casimicrobiaceae bacterium]|nr:beta/gamma crystallin-related protein [Casimicrobiaceae bacterium]